MKDIIGITFIVFGLIIILLSLDAGFKAKDSQISALEDEIESLGIVIGEYEREILRDDKLLMGFTHGTWDRECRYRIDPWTQLADGSIRQQLFQECEEK